MPLAQAHAVARPDLNTVLSERCAYVDEQVSPSITCYTTEKCTRGLDMPCYVARRLGSESLRELRGCDSGGCVHHVLLREKRPRLIAHGSSTRRSRNGARALFGIFYDDRRMYLALERVQSAHARSVMHCRHASSIRVFVMLDRHRARVRGGLRPSDRTRAGSSVGLVRHLRAGDQKKGC